MKTVYGAPAVEVENPSGELVPYVCRAVPAKPGEWRAWEVVKEDSTVYRVSELPSGFWRCTCEAWKYDRNGKGRRYKVGTQRVCKHVFPIATPQNAQTEAPTDANDSATDRRAGP